MVLKRPLNIICQNFYYNPCGIVSCILIISRYLSLLFVVYVYIQRAFYLVLSSSCPFVFETIVGFAQAHA